MNKILEFNNQEDEYLKWIESNPLGFVINVEKSDSNPVLHKADCADIQRGAHENYTTEGYKKICSLRELVLIDWCIRKSGKYHKCERCYSPNREYD